ncbi:MAG: hypothetical protein NC418_00565 [Muribaculaceae bacterium]|nr:hypothetical protein [Muribaculaceae bacterium]
MKAQSPTRILAHRIVVGSQVSTLSVADIRRDADGLWQVAVEPFSGETAATSFHSGTVEIVPAADPHSAPELIFK